MAIDLATELMDAHGWWGGGSNLTMRGGGLANVTIQIKPFHYRHYVRHADIDHIRDTILHEIAHALVGPCHGHDAVWRQKAREIGCTCCKVS